MLKSTGKIMNIMKSFVIRNMKSFWCGTKMRWMQQKKSSNCVL